MKAGECPAEWEAYPAKRRQKDTDTRWTQKHGGSHFGYKNHVNVDKQHPNGFGAIRSRMRRCMTVKCSKTCGNPRRPGGTSGPMPPIGRKRLQASSKSGTSARRFSIKRIGTSRRRPNNSRRISGGAACGLAWSMCLATR